MLSRGGRAGLIVAAGVLAVSAAACVDEFATDPPRAVTFARAAGWRDTLSVTDTVTLNVQVTDSSRGESIVGLTLSWVSSDPTVLELAPPGSGAASGQGVRAIARRRGRVQVRATVERPGFETLTFADSIVVLERWIAVSAGYAHTCALTVAREVYCWGTELGIGNGRQEGDSVPSRVLGLAGFQFKAVAAGTRHSCALSVEGLLFCWGDNSNGQLGNGDTVSRLIAVPAAAGRAFLAMDAGFGVTCGVSTDATAYCWGRNTRGETGTGSAQSGSLCEAGATCTLGPGTPVKTGPDTDVLLSSISVGTEHVCGVALATLTGTSSRLYCWGRGDIGQLGLGQLPSGTARFATLVSPQLSVGTVSIGVGERPAGRHTCALTTEGTALCWGRNNRGQLGDATSDGPEPCSTVDDPCSTIPRAVTGAAQYSAISAGGFHVCGITTDGRLFCWGSNDVGQLGLASSVVGDACTKHNRFSGERSTACSTRPMAVDTSRRFTTLSAGQRHTCAISTGGRLLCWGQNAWRLGNGQSSDSDLPMMIAEPR